MNDFEPDDIISFELPHGENEVSLYFYNEDFIGIR